MTNWEDKGKQELNKRKEEEEDKEEKEKEDGDGQEREEKIKKSSGFHFWILSKYGPISMFIFFSLLIRSN